MQTLKGGVRLKYRVIIEQDEDGVFVAEVPALPGCISQGATRVEALNTPFKKFPHTFSSPGCAENQI